MSKGISGLFSDTKGSRAAASSSNFMFPDEEFTRYIQNRKDVDANGFYDVVAHGMPDNILVVHNGKSIEVSHRVLSGLLEHDDRYGGWRRQASVLQHGQRCGHSCFYGCSGIIQGLVAS